MKKILVITALLLAHLSNAQLSSEQSNNENEKSHIQKGSWVLGGSFSIYNTNAEYNNSDINSDYTIKDKINSYSISPQIGYAFSKNWVGGLSLKYAHKKEIYRRFDYGELRSKDTTRTNSYSVSPYVTRFFNLSEKLFLNLKGSVEYTFLESKKEYDSTNGFSNSNYDGHSFFIGLAPGITYFLSNKLALESTIGSIGYRSSKSDRLGYSNIDDDPENFGSSDKNEGFRAQFNLSSIYFGVSYYF